MDEERPWRRIRSSAAMEPVFVFDSESGLIVDANPGCLAVLGYESSELAGISVAEIIGGSPQEARDHVNRMGSSEWVNLGRCTLRCRDGTRISAEVSSYRVLYRGSRCFVVLGRNPVLISL